MNIQTPIRIRTYKTLAPAKYEYDLGRMFWLLLVNFLRYFKKWYFKLKDFARVEIRSAEIFDEKYLEWHNGGFIEVSRNELSSHVALEITQEIT